MSDPYTYTIGWICAVEVEIVAAKAMFDEQHEDLEQTPHQDDNTYALGRIGRHNVVVATLPHGEYGLVNAANTARDLMRTFPNIRAGLTVGIAGGAPSGDVRLGDVVVSVPSGGNGGIFQYYYGKTTQDEVLMVTEHTNKPPYCMLKAVAMLKAEYTLNGHLLEKVIGDALEKYPGLRKKGYVKPEASTDRLYVPSYQHSKEQNIDCEASCNDASKLVVRPQRDEDEDSPKIHFGLVASSNQLIKDAHIRDQLWKDKGVLCFEMEAAGLIDHFPCVIVRGICDYADTHKNKRWQGYAAMAAAAYAKDLLLKLTPSSVAAERKTLDVPSDVRAQISGLEAKVNAGLTRAQAEGHSDNFLRWFDSPDLSTSFNKAVKARNEASGQKLLENRHT